jgi:hypothetical protein
MGGCSLEEEAAAETEAEPEPEPEPELEDKTWGMRREDREEAAVVAIGLTKEMVEAVEAAGDGSRR